MKGAKETRIPGPLHAIPYSILVKASPLDIRKARGVQAPGQYAPQAGRCRGYAITYFFAVQGPKRKAALPDGKTA